MRTDGQRAQQLPVDGGLPARVVDERRLRRPGISEERRRGEVLPQPGGAHFVNAMAGGGGERDRRQDSSGDAPNPGASDSGNTSDAGAHAATPTRSRTRSTTTPEKRNCLPPDEKNF